MVGSNHDEGPVRINLSLKSITIGFELQRFDPIFLVLRGRMKEKEDTRKKEKIMLNSVYTNVGLYFLGMCS